jgi:hypothetical protein
MANVSYFPGFRAGQSRGELRATTPSLHDRVVNYLSQFMGDNRNTYELANKLTTAAELTTPLGMATGAYDVGRRAAEAGIAPSPQTLAAAGLTAATMLPFGGRIARLAEGAAREAPNVAAMGIRAFHGSPHSFERFSTEKIGTGEGVQAYGHGLYFAGNEDVARAYRENLAPHGRGLEAEDTAARMLQAHNGNLQSALDDLAQRRKYATAPDATAHFDKVEEVLKQGKAGAGHMYQVDINADPSQFINYESPLPENVRAILNEKLAKTHLGEAGAEQFWKTAGNAGDAYVNAERFLGPAETMAAMKQAGIPGIKYADQGSRVSPEDLRMQRQMVAAYEDPNDIMKGHLSPETWQKNYETAKAKLADLESKAANPTQNYVVFDDSLINILRKYGLAGLTVGAGANALSGFLPQQQSQQ